MEYQWDDVNISHIARHGVTPPEAEEVIESDPWDLDVQILNGEERTPHLGETKAGRVLLVIAIWLEDERSVRVITAYEPSKPFRKHYLLWKGEQHGTKTKDTGVSKRGRRGSVVGRKSGDG